MGECLCLNFTSHPASDQPDGEKGTGIVCNLGEPAPVYALELFR